MAENTPKKVAAKKAATKRAPSAASIVSAAARQVSRVDGPQRAPSSNFSSELNSIDFKKMIGGPLQAAVDAQVSSALATVNFIKEVGFEKDSSGVSTNKLAMVDYSYTKKSADGTTDVATTLKVPLISTLPIPCLRIEYVEINFNVKLNSVETANSSFGLNASASAQGGFGPVSFKVSVSVQRSTSTGIKVEKEYSLNVKVRAVQDEMPAGLEKVLNLLSA
jgi:hypothetical protein